MTRNHPLQWLMCAVLVSACGGGGDDLSPAPAPPTAPAPSPAPAPGALVPSESPALRFVGFYSASGRSLTVSPLQGLSTLSSRSIARVEVAANDAPVQALAVPNATNSAGQPVYVFPLAVQGAGSTRCGPSVALAITVTATDGATFSKYRIPCNDEQFGAFSDYGERTVTFRISSDVPLVGSFARTSAGNYGDVYSRSLPAGTHAWVLRAQPGDLLNVTGSLGLGNPAAHVQVSIEADGVVLGTDRNAENKAGAAVSVTCCTR